MVDMVAIVVSIIPYGLTVRVFCNPVAIVSVYLRPCEVP